MIQPARPILLSMISFNFKNNFLQKESKKRLKESHILASRKIEQEHGKE